MSFYDVVVGLSEPMTRETEVAGMRRAIHHGAQGSGIIRSWQIGADQLGVGGEDRYVMLAYTALLEVERYARAMLRHSERSLIAPPMIQTCDCNAASGCPLGRVGSMPRCTITELRAALIKLRNPNPEGGR